MDLSTGLHQRAPPSKGRAFSHQQLPEPRLFFRNKQLLAEKMKCIGFLFFCMLMSITDARSVLEGDDREPVAMPYWPFSSSDFWSYVEYFRTLGAYNRIAELARALFAQLPAGSHLGLHRPVREE